MVQKTEREWESGEKVQKRERERERERSTIKQSEHTGEIHTITKLSGTCNHNEITMFLAVLCSWGLKGFCHRPYQQFKPKAAVVHKTTTPPLQSTKPDNDRRFCQKHWPEANVKAKQHNIPSWAPPGSREWHLAAPGTPSLPHRWVESSSPAWTSSLYPSACHWNKAKLPGHLPSLCNNNSFSYKPWFFQKISTQRERRVGVCWCIWVHKHADKQLCFLYTCTHILLCFW